MSHGLSLPLIVRFFSGVFVCVVIVLFSPVVYSQGSSDDEVLASLQGRVLDSQTLAPVLAEIDVFFDSDFIRDESLLTEQGLFDEKFKKYGWYLIQISAPGYLSKSDTVWVINESHRSIKRDFLLTRLTVGVTAKIDNIHFYFGKTTLSEQSHDELDELVPFFKANPSVVFEIAGHTDDEGAAEYNLFISQGRAESVVNYLVGKGVDKSQLVAKGYGETKPIDPGITKAAKANNRRVEFTVLNILNE